MNKPKTTTAMKRLMTILAGVGLVLAAGGVAWAALQVDIGRTSDPQLQAGWQEWNTESSTPQTASFSYADTTGGTLDARLAAASGVNARNYGLDYVTDPGNLTIPDVWTDQYFFNNNTGSSLTLTLDNLKAGTYDFTSYSYADNLAASSNDDGTVSVQVDTGGGYVDTGLDVTFVSGINGYTPVTAAKLDALATVSFQFTVANDNDQIGILYGPLSDGDTFGLNGFEVEASGPAPPPPPAPIKIDPSTLSASANSPGAGSPTFVVDGTGLDDVDNPTTHSTAYGTTGWRSADYNHSGYDEGTTPDAEWFCIDLDGQYDVDSINIWNGYEYGSGGRGLNRRLTRTDLYAAVSLGDPGNPDDNPANWTQILNDQAVAMADGVISNFTTLDLGGVTATHLALFDMRSNGTDGWSGRHIILSEIEVFEKVQAGGVIPEPSTLLIWALGLLGLAWYGRRRSSRNIKAALVTNPGAYARKQGRGTMKKLMTILRGVGLVLGVALLLESTPAYGYYMDLTGDNVDINSDSSWYNVGGGGGRRAEIGNATTGLTGYLNTTYTDSGGRPQKGEYWDVKDGHLDFQSGGNLAHGKDLKLAHPSDETAATITLNPGSTFEDTNTNDSYGLWIGYNNTRGTVTVNNGGTFGGKTDVGLGGSIAAGGGDTSTSVGVFKVIGDGGTINTGLFRISRYSEVIFELDDTGISTINVGQDLKIWNDGAGPGGKLTVDTSALLGQHTVDLFTYGSLSGTFGTVQVLGSELLPGSGTDPGTYDLSYENGKIAMTYNNPAGQGGVIPEPSTMVIWALGLLGLGWYGWRKRFRI